MSQKCLNKAITKGKCLCVLDLLDSGQNMDYEMFGPAIASNQRGNMEQEIFSNCHLVRDAYLENTETFYPNEHEQGETDISPKKIHKMLNFRNHQGNAKQNWQ